MPSPLLMQRPPGSVPFAQQGSQVRPDIPAYNPKFPSAPVIWPVGSREAAAAAQVTQRNGAPTQRSALLGLMGMPGQQQQQPESKFVILNPQEIPLPSRVAEAAKLRHSKPRPITEWTVTR